MKQTARSTALSLALCAATQGAWALGFGSLPTGAILGQPLDLVIPVRLDPGEDLDPACIVGRVMFAEELQQPGTTSVRLDPAAPGATTRSLRLRTTTRVDEPVVSVDISVGCTATVSRRFTLFADPPLIAEAQAAAARLAPQASAAAPSSAPTAPTARLAPAPRAVSAAPRPARPPASRPAAAKRAVPAVPAAAAVAPAPARPGAAATAATAAPGAKLELAPLEDGAAVAVAQAAASAAAAEQAASAASAASAAEAAARTRVAELEATMARMRSEAASAQQQLGGLQSQLQRLQAEGGGRNLVGLLGALLFLALVGLAWMWRQRNQEREALAWSDHAAGNPGEGTPEGDAATAEAVAFAPNSDLSGRGSRPAGEGFSDSDRAALVSPLTQPWPVSAPSPLPAAPVAKPVETKREVSVEELIDLEQQAEFFVVLGQDEAAIDLLMGHLRSTSGTSPLPYLKLLEIYKRRDERKPYEQLRERFNSRFSTIAPAWETDLQDGRSLEDYPAVVARLQSLWGRPHRSMEVLQATLLRSDETSAPGDNFDLPAYRELMLMYAIARDRSEADVGGNVDLLLPIGDVDATSSGVFERLVATTSLEAQPAVHKALTVDVRLDIDEDPGPTTSAAAHGFLPTDIDPASNRRKT